MNIRTKIGDVLLGLAFVIAGVLIAANAFGYIKFENYFDGWWTLFILVPCAINIIKSGFKTSNVIGLVIGGALLLIQQVEPKLQDMAYEHFGLLIIALILIAIGAQIALRIRLPKIYLKSSADQPADFLNFTAVFGGCENNLAGQKISGLNITAIFGGVELDLREAIIENDIVIKSVNVFGGSDLFLPHNVNVKMSGVPIFGGVDNKAVTPTLPDAPTVYVDYVCVFGGMDIK